MFPNEIFGKSINPLIHSLNELNIKTDNNSLLMIDNHSYDDLFDVLAPTPLGIGIEACSATNITNVEVISLSSTIQTSNSLSHLDSNNVSLVFSPAEQDINIDMSLESALDSMEYLSVSNNTDTIETLEEIPNSMLNSLNELSTSNDSVGSTPTEDPITDNAQITKKAILTTQYINPSETKISKKMKQLQFDGIYQYDTQKSVQIQITNQPRKEYRPRTLNESKTSAHYIRCEHGDTADYPTIKIDQRWRSANFNYIEVSLKAVDSTPHPYRIDNRSCDTRLSPGQFDRIIKDEPNNLLYFPVTEEDFVKGFKTFQVELIKSLQSDTITKELIKAKQLDKSYLVFTRCYIGQYGVERDQDTMAQSNCMTEGYGSVEVDIYTPTTGASQEYSSNWSHKIVNFTKNGNCVYFNAPPYQQLVGTATVDIVVSYQEEEIASLPYTYNESSIPSSTMSIDQLGLMMSPSCQISTTTNKRTKRLQPPMKSKLRI
ncbi:unnamed protein product [Didymodactylos carnosus]|uniref:Uncharacterized protein n=1 Tax=Didymodactylos carnosus TaxID=1234261 RepID=A0A814B7N4_9BILA|nr:unnamed protein product [Didymodactylos carnosus]CAF0924342.1 unnamed protein product [Didymodactylos carnosus]CAF3556676.1 unnamed protein product [Didymodactylos carnosus]CAF3703266.1 unnamed protein product [Didymodactylos carnosus]